MVEISNFPSRSEAAWSVALSMAARVACWEEFERAARSDNVLSAHLGERADGRPFHEHTIESRTEALWWKVRHRVEQHPTIGTADDVSAIVAELRDVRIAGKNADRDRVVFGLLLDCAEKNHTTTPAVSTRELWKSPQSYWRSRTTIDAALRSLIARKLITQLPSTEARISAGQPNRYRLRTAVPMDKNDHDHLSYMVCDSWSEMSIADTDLVLAAVTGAALKALRVLRAHQGQPVTAKELAKLAGICEKTAGRQLPRLARLKLAERTEQGWILGSAEPAAVAADSGAAAMREAREATAERERQNYRAQLPQSQREMVDARVVYFTDERGRNRAYFTAPELPEGLVIDPDSRRIRAVQNVRTVSGQYVDELTGEIVAEPVPYWHAASPVNRNREPAPAPLPSLEEIRGLLDLDRVETEDLELARL